MEDFLRVQKDALRVNDLCGLSISTSVALAFPLVSLLKLRKVVGPRERPLARRRSSDFRPSLASVAMPDNALSFWELLTRRGNGLPFGAVKATVLTCEELGAGDFSPSP